MIKRLLIFLILLIAVPCWGAVYVDPLCDSGAPHYACDDGSTYLKPQAAWPSPPTVDTRQLCGTTYTGVIAASNGSILLGAYNADGSHEDGGNETFGQNCSGGEAKPIIDNGVTGVTQTGEDAIVITASGVEVNSLAFEENDIHIDVRADDAIVRYTYMKEGNYGIQLGWYADADNFTAEYNYIDLEASSPDGGGLTIDGIGVGYYAQSGTVQYNYITGFDHDGINLHSCDNIVIQYNKIEAGVNEEEDICISSNSITSSFNAPDSNVIRYNYCKNAGLGMQIWGMVDNEIYANVFTCDGDEQPSTNTACIKIYSDSDSAYDGAQVTGNKFYNNVVYDNDNYTDGYGFQIVVGAGTNASNSVANNWFVNNVIEKINDYCFRVVDNADIVGTNYFYNNICYDRDGGSYSDIEGDPDITADDFNTGIESASGNLGTNPSLSNPAGGEFWPDSSSDPVVGTGYTLSSPYNQLLVYTSDFTASPPVVNLQTQEDNNIGAYVSSDAGPVESTYPLQGAAGDFKYN